MIASMDVLADIHNNPLKMGQARKPEDLPHQVPNGIGSKQGK